MYTIECFCALLLFRFLYFNLYSVYILPILFTYCVRNNNNNKKKTEHIYKWNVFIKLQMGMGLFSVCSFIRFNFIIFVVPFSAVLTIHYCMHVLYLCTTTALSMCVLYRTLMLMLFTVSVAACANGVYMSKLHMNRWEWKQSDCRKCKV